MIVVTEPALIRRVVWESLGRAVGLIEEQARETPCRSALSVGGIIKHAAYVMRGALERLSTEVTEQPVDTVAYAAFTDSFAVRDDETVPRPSRTSTACGLSCWPRSPGPIRRATPWRPPRRGTGSSTLGRSTLATTWCTCRGVRPDAGHADISREQIDGVEVPTLVLTLAGANANDFFQLYRPASGTLLG